MFKTVFQKRALIHTSAGTYFLAPLQSHGNSIICKKRQQLANLLAKEKCVCLSLFLLLVINRITDI